MSQRHSKTSKRTSQKILRSLRVSPLTDALLSCVPLACSPRKIALFPLLSAPLAGSLPTRPSLPPFPFSLSQSSPLASLPHHPSPCPPPLQRVSDQACATRKGVPKQPNPLFTQDSPRPHLFTSDKGSYHPPVNPFPAEQTDVRQNCTSLEKRVHL